MIKSRLIGHLSELENIRRDEYMSQEIKDKVVELEKLIAQHLMKELENPNTSKFKTSGSKELDELLSKVEGYNPPR